MTPKAFLLDLDGGITDTARFHYLAWKRLCDELHFHFNEQDNERLKGVSRSRSLEIILEINDCLQRLVCGDDTHHDPGGYFAGNPAVSAAVPRAGYPVGGSLCQPQCAADPAATAAGYLF